MLMLTWLAAKAGAAIRPRTARLCLMMFIQSYPLKAFIFGRVDASVVKKAAITHASTGAPVLLLVVEQNSGWLALAGVRMDAVTPSLVQLPPPSVEAPVGQAQAAQRPGRQQLYGHRRHGRQARTSAALAGWKVSLLSLCVPEADGARPAGSAGGLRLAERGAGPPVQQTGEVYPRGSRRVRTEITLAVKTFTRCR
jgi:hypothetical protein